MKVQTGADITQNLSDRLISLTMTDNRGFEADQLDIDLDDSDGLVELPSRGASLTLWLSWECSALLSFTVYEIEHRCAPDTLNSRLEQSWHDTTLGVIL
jgi:phage protein D